MAASRRQQKSNSLVPSPAKKFLEFQGSKGHYLYYDNEKKEKVIVKNPQFLIVKETTTVTGWNKSNGGLFSNEVEDGNTEELDVRYYKGDKKNIAKGLWKDIKQVVTARNTDGKYTRSVYIALHDKVNGWGLDNIKLSGKQLTSWIDLHNRLKAANVEEWQVMISIDTIEFDDSGSIHYYYPTFKYQLLDEDKVPAHKVIMTKADAYCDIVEDFLQKRKDGVTDATPERRKESSSPAVQSKAQDKDPFDDSEEKSPLQEESIESQQNKMKEDSSFEEEEEDDFPF
jgi:hypothetical protein